MTDFSRKHSWWDDAARLYLKLITRAEATRRGVPPMRKPKFAAELDDLRQMSEWVHWNHSGRPKPRPKVWARVPPYAKRMLAEFKAAHPKPPPSQPPPLPEKQPPASSWFLPGPIILNASDPDGCLNPATGKPRAGIGSIGTIVVPGVAPVWRVIPVHGAGVGWVAQIEGPGQVAGAVDYLRSVPSTDSRAVVSTLNTSAAPLLDLGVTACFYELNAQAGWEPYGNNARLAFQAGRDGWPHAHPSYGVYVPVSLAEYGAYVPMVWDAGSNQFVRGTRPQGFGPEPWMVFSSSGMGDTDSWGTLAAL